MLQRCKQEHSRCLRLKGTSTKLETLVHEQAQAVAKNTFLQLLTTEHISSASCPLCPPHASLKPFLKASCGDDGRLHEDHHFESRRHVTVSASDPGEVEDADLW
jgi:hypothetical protein